jgi:VanZ family protein
VSAQRLRTAWDRAALFALPAYWIALAIATHYPRVTIPDQVPGNDKLVHFTAFGLLAFLRWRFEHALRPIGARFVWTAGAVLIAYAALDEYLQKYFGRFTDPLDFLANTSGIVVVLTILEIDRRRRIRAGVASTREAGMD